MVSTNLLSTYLPPALTQVPDSTLVLIITSFFIIATLVTLISAWICSAPKQTLLVALSAVTLHFLSICLAAFILSFIHITVKGGALFIIVIITAVLMYSFCFSTSLRKGILITLFCAIIYTLLNKTLASFLPDYFPQWAEMHNVLMKALSQLF